MNNYCYYIKCPVEPFKDPNYPLDILKTIDYKHAIIDRFRYVNPELFYWYKSLGVKINIVEIFYRPADNKGDIHVDRGLGDKIKMNWIYGQDDSSMMNWYNHIQTDPSVSSITVVNTPYITFKEENCKLLHSQLVQSPSVCQTGVPHNVTNGSKPRLCVSFDLLELSTMSGITFSRSQEIFKDYIEW